MTDEERDNKDRAELTMSVLERILEKLQRLDDRVADLSQEVQVIRDTMDRIRASQLRREAAEEGRRFLAERTTHDTDPAPAPSSNGGP